MFFKIKCYINFIKYDKYKKKGKVNICISDDDELQRFQNNLLKLYCSDNKTNNFNKKLYDLKINSNTKIDLNVDYKNIDELKGIYVTISASSKYYCFSIDSHEFDEHTNLFTPVKKIIKGYSIYITKITNRTN
jgi:hypothetical protein